MRVPDRRGSSFPPDPWKVAFVLAVLLLSSAMAIAGPSGVPARTPRASGPTLAPPASALGASFVSRQHSPLNPPGPPRLREFPNATTNPAVGAQVVSTVDLLNGAVHPGPFGGTGGGFPWAVLADPSRGLVYVTLFFSERVAAVDPLTGRIVADAPVGLEPASLALSPDGQALFVGNSGGTNISVLNASTFAPVTSIQSGSSAFAVDSKDSRLFAADWSSNNVTVINTSSYAVEGNIPTGRSPNDLAYDAGDSLLFVANSQSANVSVINASSSAVVRSVPVGLLPEAVRWDSASRTVFVANRGSNTVSVFGPNATSVSVTVSTGTNPGLLAVDPSRDSVLVGNDTGVEFLDDRTNTSVGWVGLGAGPASMDTLEPLGVGFASDQGNETLVELNLTSRLESGAIQLGVDPSAAAVATGPGQILLAESTNNSVDIVSTTDYTHFGNVPVGQRPDAIAFDPATGTAYVANFRSNNVSEISLASPSGGPSVPVGQGPEALVLANGTVFVANELSDTLTLIDAATGAVETTVPGGSGPDALAFDNQTGLVYVADGSSGLVTVVAAASGATEATITVGWEPEAIAYCPTLDRIFVASFSDGALTVIDSSAGRVVGSVGIGTDGDGVTCDGATGYVDVSHRVFDNVSIVDGATLAVVGTVDVGSFPTSATFDASTNAVVVTNDFDSTASILSSPTPTASVVRFTESGLPTGTSWTVDLNGMTGNSTGTSVDFREPNGSLPFTVPSVLGYSPTPSAGTANITGAPVEIAIEFRAVTGTLYPVTFLDGGLAATLSWSITFGGMTQSSAGAAIVFRAGNGTYGFTVGLTRGFSASPSSGQVTVAGAPVDRTIEFVSTLPGEYLVTFTESTLGAGTNWSVSLDGTPHVSTTGSIAFTEPNGTYAYSVGAVTGYTVTTGASTIVVNGGPISTSVTFAASAAASNGGGNPSTLLGVPAVYLYLLVVGVAAGVAGGVVGVRLRRRGPNGPADTAGPPEDRPRS